MPYHPSSLPSKAKGSNNELLRVLGAFLSLSGMILAAVSIFFHQSTPGIVISIIVGLFGLRVFMLWLRARARSVTPVSTPVSRRMAPTPASHEYSFFSTAPKSANTSLSPGARASPAPVIHSLRRSPASSLSHVPITTYPSQPAYAAHAAQTSYAQTQQPPILEKRRPQAPASLAPYIPPIFELDPPAGNVECFILPKEGAPLVECQDRYALHAKHRCYAVADGVAGSFVPGPWARIIAKGFVERNGTFLNKEDFQDWLMKCSQQWHGWLDNRWLPTIQAISTYSGNGSGDRSKEIRPAAQTTLIGCSLLSQREQQGAASAVSVFAIGDCQFFLFRPNTGWNLVETFPYSDPDEFGSRPVTLVTTLRADLIERAWTQRKTKLCKVYSGDIIVLASDTLAKWLLTRGGIVPPDAKVIISNLPCPAKETFVFSGTATKGVHVIPISITWTCSLPPSPTRSGTTPIPSLTPATPAPGPTATSSSTSLSTPQHFTTPTVTAGFAPASSSTIPPGGHIPAGSQASLFTIAAFVLALAAFLLYLVPRQQSSLLFRILTLVLPESILRRFSSQ